MVPSTVTLVPFFLLESVTLLPAEEENAPTWFRNRLTWYVGTAEKGTMAVLPPHSEMAFKDMERKIFPNGVTASIAPHYPFCVEGEAAQVENIYRFLSTGQWPRHLVRGLKKKN